MIPPEPFAIECSHCNTQYTFEEMMKLKKTPAKKGEIKKYGYNAVCSKCKKQFHKNKWQLKKSIFLNGIDKRLHPKYPQKHIWVSTVHLEFYHRRGMYETMYFVVDENGKKIHSRNYKNYDTKEDATLGHALACSMIHANKKTIILEDDDKKSNL